MNKTSEIQSQTSENKKYKDNKISNYKTNKIDQELVDQNL